MQHKGISHSRRNWIKCTNTATWFIPDRWISFESLERKIAWREKFTLFSLILSLCGMLLVYLIVLPSWLCPEQLVMSLNEVESLPKYMPHIVIFGRVYNLSEFAQLHHTGDAIPHHIYEYAGKDVSFMFPRPGLPDSLNEVRRAALTGLETEDSAFKPFFHSTEDTLVGMSTQSSWDLCFDWNRIGKASTRREAWIVVHGRIYSIDQLLDEYEAASRTSLVSLEQIAEFITHPDFAEAISPPWGRDKTRYFDYASSKMHINYLLESYFVGVVDMRQSAQCILSSYLLLGSTALMVLVLVVKFLSSLQFGQKGYPEKLNRHVGILMSCYSEDENTLRNAINSVANLSYDSSKKVLIIVVDGIVVGKGNSISTAVALMKILGLKDDLSAAKRFSYSSLSVGAHAINYGSIFSGKYQLGDELLSYLLIIKTGSRSELIKPGNRGKRDSQMLFLRFLNRANQNSPLSPMETQIYWHLKFVLNIEPKLLEFLMMLDADTIVYPDSLNRLLSCCIHDSKIIGICGETKIRNEKCSWITMIQVFEYFISHHMSKAFESLFGCVTCLPGCFCMYRLKNLADGDGLLLLNNQLLDDYGQVVAETLHEKNLLLLGEDRYLTTLALKHFPLFRTKFTQDALCETKVPETWSVLLSQRRRWINSTIHNLIELLLLQNLCGFCCFSMRFVIFMELISTVILPATVIYISYLFFKAFTANYVATISIFMLAAVYGLQLLLLILRGQWRQVGWMLLYFLSIPIFGLLIPMYAFWQFDDFSWGETRQLEDAYACDAVLGGSDEPLVLKTWEEYQTEKVE